MLRLIPWVLFSFVVLVALVVVCAPLALAQGAIPPEVTEDIIMQLYTMVGWPGLIGGVVVVGLGIWRKMAPSVWDSWPRWARFGLGFLAPALSTAAFKLLVVGLGAWPVAIVAGLTVGISAIFTVEAVKTAKAPQKKRTGHLIGAARLPIEGPDGTGVSGSKGW